MAKMMKKHLKHCKYDSVAKFGMEGIGINTIILFFCNENWENIMYLSLKAVQWFTICGMSPPSGLTIGWIETQLLLSHFYQ